MVSDFQPDLGGLAEQSFAAVIFDNDGTLVDSTPAVARSWMIWAKEHDVPAEALGRHHGVPAASIIAELAPDTDPEASLARITALEIADTHDVVALPGAVEAVRALLPDTCTVATSATRELGLVRLRAAGIPIPKVVVTFDDVERGKPHPDPFLVAAERLGVDPTQCLVVEDAPSGLRAAHAAGCFTLALTTTTPRQDLHADAIVATLADVRFTTTDGGVRLSLA